MLTLKTPILFSKTVAQLFLKENGDDQDRENIDDFDHRIDRRSGRVLVRIADSIAGDCCGMSKRTFAAEISLLNKFLRIVPGGATGGRCFRDATTGHHCATEQ